MSVEQCRPPGRSNRSGRSNADNDVFEGLPVKQWGQTFAKVSLAPPVSEAEPGKDDKWGEPPMPRDYQLLLPWTQYLLRLARSGRVGTKRKQDAEIDEDKPDDEMAEEDPKPIHDDDRGYVTTKWKLVPEHSLEPEHMHFSFLAKRRRGMPHLYGPDQEAAAIPMRKTKVQKAGSSGEVTVYEVLVPEGQTIEGEIAESMELADVKLVTAAPGTVVEGVGVANEEGVMVAEHLKSSIAPRRNRPPAKKRGGPGRGKKRVTFTNPDGSTYTAIVPNATKIVPQPGQTIKHVAKGEEATADVSVEQASTKTSPHLHGEEDGGEEGSGDDGEEGEDDDDDREDGELSDDETLATVSHTPAPPGQIEDPEAMEDVQPTGQSTQAEPAPREPVPPELAQPDSDVAKPSIDGAKTANDTHPSEHDPHRSAESSPELPLAQSHSRKASLAEPTPLSLAAPTPLSLAAPAPLSLATAGEEEGVAIPAGAELAEKEVAPPHASPATARKFADGDDDLLSTLERSLG